MKKKIGSRAKKSLGLLLKEKRKAKKLTQELVAKKIGVSRYSIIRMEHGSFVPRGDKFVRLGKLLGIKIDSLGL